MDEAKAGPLCINCEAPTVLRNSKAGKFWGCSRFPNCKQTQSLNPKNEPKCDECGMRMVKRVSEAGVFWGCLQYPSCTFTRDIDPKRPNQRCVSYRDELDPDAYEIFHD